MKDSAWPASHTPFDKIDRTVFIPDRITNGSTLFPFRAGFFSLLHHPNPEVDRKSRGSFYAVCVKRSQRQNPIYA